MDTQKLLMHDQLALEGFRAKILLERDIYGLIDLRTKMLGIVGLRWVGKTTFLLKQRSTCQNSVYISCDLVGLRWVDFFSLVKEMKDVYDITTFFLDEIHFLDEWSWILKNIYDFLDVKVIFSGSSMINIVQWKYDLSRRAVDYTMPIFSFREYLNITKWLQIRKYGLEEIINNHTQIARDLSNVFSPWLFEKYLDFGQFGYFYEGGGIESYSMKLENSVKKSIYEDLSQTIDISTENLSKFEKILYFMAHTATSELSLNSLSKQVWLTVKTMWLYINFLSELGWIIPIEKYGKLSDTLRKQQKIYFSNTNILDCFWHKINIWNVRETFFVDMLNIEKTYNRKLKLYYKTQTDFVVEYDGIVREFEVWVKNKKRSERNIFVIKDDIVIGKNNEIPLWLFWLV